MKGERSEPTALNRLSTAESDPDMWELRLYVAGKTARSVAAFESPRFATVIAPAAVSLIPFAPVSIAAVTVPAAAVLIASTTSPIVLAAARLTLIVDPPTVIARSFPLDALRIPRPSFTALSVVARPR